MPKSSFSEIQQNFTDHIRRDEFVPIDGIEDRRLQVYRELFYNNLESFISGTFPVLKECISDEHWHKMVRTFFIHHSCKSPYFLEISEEFLQYLAQDTENQLNLPEYAYSLAHWEWMELFADAYVEEKPPRLTPIELDIDILKSIECAWLQAYEYPVHLIEAELDVQPQPTFLLIYRDSNQKVGFIELNPMSYLLFQTLQDNSTSTIAELVESIAHNHNMNAEQLLPGAMAVLAQWIDLQLIEKVSK